MKGFFLIIFRPSGVPNNISGQGAYTIFLVFFKTYYLDNQCNNSDIVILFNLIF